MASREEDYLDALLRGVEISDEAHSEEESTETRSAEAIFTDIMEDVPDRPTEGPGADLIIDSAPSLSEVDFVPIEEDVADLMAELLPSLDTQEESAEPGSDLFSFDSDSAMSDFLAGASMSSLLNLGTDESESISEPGRIEPSDIPGALTTDDLPSVSHIQELLIDDIPDDIAVDAPTDVTADVSVDIFADTLLDIPDDVLIDVPESAPDGNPDDISSDDASEGVLLSDILSNGDEISVGDILSAGDVFTVEDIISSTEAVPADSELLFTDSLPEAEAEIPSDPLSDLDAFLTANAMSEEPAGNPDDALTLDEEDLSALLDSLQNDTEAVSGTEPTQFASDVDMLLNSGDVGFTDIGSMLERADHNEAISPEIEALLNPIEPSLEELMNSEEELALDPKEEKRLKKQRAKEEKLKAKEEKARVKEEKAKAKQEKTKEEKTKVKRKLFGKAAKQVEDENPLIEESLDSELGDIEALLAAAEESAQHSNSGEIPVNPFADNPEFAGGMFDDVMGILSGDSIPEMTDDSIGSSGTTILEQPVGVFEPDSPSDVESSTKQNDEFSGFDIVDLSDLPDDVDLFGNSASSSSESDQASDEPADDSVSEEKAKKKGLLARLIEFLTETDEDEEETSGSGTEDIQLSDENTAILQELDSEVPKDKKKKKKDKKEKKNTKDKKGESEGGENEGEESEGGDDKKKKKKEKKPKKEKKVKEQPLVPEKKLNKKRVILIFAICLSLAVLLGVFSIFGGEFSTKKAGREAYLEGDYQTCYQNLYGKNLNSTEEVMYYKSECILRIRLWIREYEILKEDGEDVLALDSLIQTVNDYPNLYRSAVKWDCTAEVESSYSEILLLLNEYGLSEQDALSIASITDDLEYTRAVMHALKGDGIAYENQNNTEPSVIPNDELPDLLPEEGENHNSGFIEP